MSLPSSSTTLPPPAAPFIHRGNAPAVLAALALVSMLAFEAMALAAAMPAIAAALDGLALYAPAFGGLVAASVVGMVAAGRSCDRHGARRATAWGLGLFVAGLCVAGSAPAMAWVVAGRALQGLGSGMLGVALYVGMGQLVPASQHPRLFAAFAAAWVVPGLVGPAVATALVAWLGWRSVFFAVAAVVPLAAALLLPAFARLPRPAAGPAAADRRLAWALLAAGGALALHGAGQSSHPVAQLAWLALGAGAAGGAAMRLLPGGSLRAAPGLPAVIALRGLLAAAFGCAEAFLPLMLQQAAGWSLAQAGIALSAGAVMWSAGSALQARLQAPAHRRRGLQLGLAGVATGTLLVAAPLWLPLPVALATFAGWSLTGLGIGLSFPMLSVLTLALSTPGEQGRNASALQLADALATSAALALAGALFAAGAGPQAYGPVLLLPTLLALLGLVLARRAFA